jgi:Flp pilus assembly protein TadD
VKSGFRLPASGFRLAVFVLGACTSAPETPKAPPHDPVHDEIAAAETAERARHHEDARAHYERAVAAAHEPKAIAFARRDYAETLASWGEVPAAIAQLEQAVAAVPADAAAWHDLGILRHHEHDDPGAIVALVKARAAAPADPRPRIALAALYWSTHDTADARREYTELLALDLPDRLRDKVKWALEQLK